LAFALLLRLSRSKGYILFLIIHQLENEEEKKILKVTKKTTKTNHIYPNQVQ
jgi:hypothetical protein